MDAVDERTLESGSSVVIKHGVGVLDGRLRYLLYLKGSSRLVRIAAGLGIAISALH